jgi:hypothetical protein
MRWKPADEEQAIIDDVNTLKRVSPRKQGISNQQGATK